MNGEQRMASWMFIFAATSLPIVYEFSHWETELYWL